MTLFTEVTRFRTRKYSNWHSNNRLQVNTSDTLFFFLSFILFYFFFLFIPMFFSFLNWISSSAHLEDMLATLEDRVLFFSSAGAWDEVLLATECVNTLVPPFWQRTKVNLSICQVSIPLLPILWDKQDKPVDISTQEYIKPYSINTKKVHVYERAQQYNKQKQ